MAAGRNPDCFVAFAGLALDLALDLVEAACLSVGRAVADLGLAVEAASFAHASYYSSHIPKFSGLKTEK